MSAPFILHTQIGFGNGFRRKAETVFEITSQGLLFPSHGCWYWRERLLDGFLAQNINQDRRRDGTFGKVGA